MSRVESHVGRQWFAAAFSFKCQIKSEVTVIADALSRLFGIAERAVKAEEMAKLSYKEIPFGRGKRRILFANGESEDIQKRIVNRADVRIDHFPSRVKELVQDGGHYVVFVGQADAWCRIEDDEKVTPVNAELVPSSQLQCLEGMDGGSQWMSPSEIVSFFSLNLQDCFKNESEFKSFVKCFRNVAAERKRSQSSGAANSTYGASVSQDLKSNDGNIEAWEYLTLKVKCFEADFIQPENIRLVLTSDPETMRFQYDVVSGDIDRAREKTVSQVINWMQNQFADPLLKGTVSVVCGSQQFGYETCE